MKVEEARGKFCCRMQVNDTRDSLLMCEANECMAWRWNDPEVKHEGYCGLAGKEGAE